MLTANDFVALEIIRILNEQGIAVLGKLSVYGFDDVFGAHYTALTSLQQKGLTTVD